jgi:hypothetical protein
MCGWPPAGKGFLRVSAAAVTCGHVSGLLSRPRPQALMGAVDRDLIKPTGSRCPLTQQRSLSIRRLTDIAITRVHPRKPSAGTRRSGSRRPGPEVLLTHHDRPSDARHLVGKRHGRDLAQLGREQLDQPGVLLGALAHNTDIAPFTSSRRR